MELPMEMSTQSRNVRFVADGNCQRKVEMSGLLQFRNVRFQDLRQG
jgi:hypothetical protein